MDVQVARPSSERLSHCVDCIYFLRHDPEDSARYISFPSVFTNLSLLRQARLEHTDEDIHIIGDRNSGPVQIYRRNLLKPCLVSYGGMVEEVTIFFRPLGVQYFPLLNQRITATDTFLSYRPVRAEALSWNAIWTEKGLTEKMYAIESILDKWWQPFSHPFLDQAIQRLAEDPALTTESLAYQVGISRKTMHQHFEKYLGLSPSQYRKITRFRNAVREKMESRQPPTLTELAYSMEFFDQSHMIRDFKSLTGFIPREYFKKIRTIENSSIQWMMR